MGYHRIMFSRIGLMKRRNFLSHATPGFPWLWKRVRTNYLLYLSYRTRKLNTHGKVYK